MSTTRDVEVPPKLVTFARRITRALDSRDPDSFVDADDAVQCGYASGGRVGPGRFFIAYHLRSETWDITLDEPALRRLAAGATSRIAAQVHTKSAPAVRARLGDALVIHGSPAHSCSRVATNDEVDTLVRGLPFGALATGVVFRSTHGDLVCVARPDDSAYVGVVFESGEHAYLASAGDPAQCEPCPAQFPLLDAPVALTFADYVSLDGAIAAVRKLVIGGALDPTFPWEARMHGDLLMTLPERVQRLALPAATTSLPPAPAPRAGASPKDPAIDVTSEAARATALIDALVARGAIELEPACALAPLLDALTAVLENIDARVYGPAYAARDALEILVESNAVAEVFIDEEALVAFLAKLNADVSGSRHPVRR